MCEKYVQRNFSKRNATAEDIEKELNHLNEKIDSINVSSNRLTAIPQFTPILSLQYLKEIIITDNSIPHVTTENFPNTVECLNIDNCDVQTIDSLQEFNNLKILSLQNNNIKTLNGLPPFLQNIHLDQNPIAILHNCFPNENVYHIVLKELESNQQLQSIKYPSPKALSAGYEEIFLRSQFDEQKITRRSCVQLFVLGDSGTGKAALIRNLTKHGQVKNSNIWYLTDTDIYYVHGQKCAELNTLLNLFLPTLKGVILLLYNISNKTEESKQSFISMLKCLLHHKPIISPRIVLTFVDKLKASDKEKICAEFTTFVKDSIRDEIDCLKVWSKNATDKKHVNKLVNTHEIFLANFVDEIFLVSNLNLLDTNRILEYLKRKAIYSRIDIPINWYQLFEFLGEQGKKLWEVKEIKQQWQAFSESEVFDCLQFFNDNNLIILKYSNIVLQIQDYVFHIQFIINILHDILRRDLVEAVARMQEVDSLHNNFDTAKYRDLIRKHKKEGIVTKDLLDVLWMKYNLKSCEKKALLQLLIDCRIYHQISDDENYGVDYLFFPWFIKNDPPLNFDLCDPLKVNSKTFSQLMICKFFGKIPENVCQIFCLELHKYAVTNHYNGDREAWTNGLKVCLDRVECFVYGIEEAQSIYCYVSSPVEDVIKAWQTITDLYDVFVKLGTFLKEVYFECAHCAFKGLEKGKRHIWPLDNVWSQNRKTKFNETVSHASSVERFVNCPNTSEKLIPSGLIIAFTKYNEDSEQLVKEVSKYLTEEPEGEKMEMDREKKDWLSYRKCRSTFLQLLYSEDVIANLPEDIIPQKC